MRWLDVAMPDLRSLACEIEHVSSVAGSRGDRLRGLLAVGSASTFLGKNVGSHDQKNALRVFVPLLRYRGLDKTLMARGNLAHDFFFMNIPCRTSRDLLP